MEVGYVVTSKDVYPDVHRFYPSDEELWTEEGSYIYDLPTHNRTPRIRITVRV